MVFHFFFKNYPELFELYIIAHSSSSRGGKFQFQEWFSLQSLGLNAWINKDREDLNLALSLPWRIFYQSDFKYSVAAPSEEFAGFCFPVGKPLRVSSISLNILMRRGEEEIFDAAEGISHSFCSLRRLQTFPRIQSPEKERWECDERRWKAIESHSLMLLLLQPVLILNSPWPLKWKSSPTPTNWTKGLLIFVVLSSLLLFKGGEVVNGCRAHMHTI